MSRTSLANVLHFAYTHPFRLAPAVCLLHYIPIAHHRPLLAAMPLTCWIPVPPDVYWAREWAEDAVQILYQHEGLPYAGRTAGQQGAHDLCGGPIDLGAHNLVKGAATGPFLKDLRSLAGTEVPLPLVPDPLVDRLGIGTHILHNTGGPREADEDRCEAPLA